MFEVKAIVVHAFIENETTFYVHPLSSTGDFDDGVGVEPMYFLSQSQVKPRLKTRRYGQTFNFSLTM